MTDPDAPRAHPEAERLPEMGAGSTPAGLLTPATLAVWEKDRGQFLSMSLGSFGLAGVSFTEDHHEA